VIDKVQDKDRENASLTAQNTYPFARDGAADAA
jgi:hypothetical protein